MRALVLAVVALLPVVAARAAGDADAGQSLYAELCQTCHGRDMVKTGLAFDLRTFPHDDVARFRSSVRNGKGTVMPSWKDKLSPEDIDDLWAYVLTGGS